MNSRRQNRYRKFGCDTISPPLHNKRVHNRKALRRMTRAVHEMTRALKRTGAAFQKFAKSLETQ